MSFNLFLLNYLINLILIGIKQTAKIVNSKLMELINGLDDNIDDTKENKEVIKFMKTENIMY